MIFSACEKSITPTAVYADNNYSNTKGNGRDRKGRGAFRGSKGRSGSRGYNRNDRSKRGRGGGCGDYTSNEGIVKDQCRFCYKYNYYQKDCCVLVKAKAFVRKGKKGKDDDDDDEEAEVQMAEGDQYNGTVYSGSVMYVIDSNTDWIFDSGVIQYFTDQIDNLEYVQY
ncbi:hypothetical protein OCU04_007382 [Sclerotinia nivalis]|uniref:Uncharacterized protein n=1 Tax=Sclerotinia nivalis TaxID=352851 RepID=A0A9X0AIM9_9HELO|nr:hypothetical protein OCU04_007382 [Sclerotinia nivalis]